MTVLHLGSTTQDHLTQQDVITEDLSITLFMHYTCSSKGMR